MVTDRHVHTFTPTNTSGRAWREGGGEDLSQLLYSKTVGTMHLCSTSWLFEATGNARIWHCFFFFHLLASLFRFLLFPSVLFLPFFFFLIVGISAFRSASRRFRFFSLLLLFLLSFSFSIHVFFFFCLDDDADNCESPVFFFLLLLFVLGRHVLPLLVKRMLKKKKNEKRREKKKRSRLFFFFFSEFSTLFFFLG